MHQDSENQSACPIAQPCAITNAYGQSYTVTFANPFSDALTVAYAYRNAYTSTIPDRFALTRANRSNQQPNPVCSSNP